MSFVMGIIENEARWFNVDLTSYLEQNYSKFNTIEYSIEFVAAIVYYYLSKLSDTDIKAVMIINYNAYPVIFLFRIVS